MCGRQKKKSDNVTSLGRTVCKIRGKIDAWIRRAHVSLFTSFDNHVRTVGKDIVNFNFQNSINFIISNENIIKLYYYYKIKIVFRKKLQLNQY